MLLLDLLSISLRVGVDPRLTVLQGIHDLFLLLFIQLLTEALVLTGSLDG